MKTIDYLLIALVCFMILLYHFTYSKEILGHPYMGFLMTVLFGVGGYSLGCAIGRIKSNQK